MKVFNIKCKHRNLFMDTFATYPTLIQYIVCIDCDTKFWGYGGFIHEPKWIQEIKTKEIKDYWK